MERKITYRWTRPEDGAALVRLHRRSILLHAVRSYTPDIARSWAYDMQPERFAKAIAKGEAIEVAILNGAVVGFCGTKDDEIAGLYVDPAFTRRGVASGLMRRALKRVRAEGWDRVRVNAALSGVPFYEAAGFRPLAARMHATRGGCEMLIVEMVLDGLAELRNRSPRAEAACAS